MSFTLTIVRGPVQDKGARLQVETRSLPTKRELHEAIKELNPGFHKKEGKNHTVYVT